MSQSKKYNCVVEAGNAYELPGGKLFLLSETSADVTVKIFRDGRKVKTATDISDVWKYRAEKAFDMVTLESSVNQTVEVFIDDDGDVTVNKIGGSVAADKVVPSGLNSNVDVSIGADTTSLVLAANAGREECIIANLPSNIETFRVGDSECGAANGTPLAPGATLILTTTAVIYAYNPGASAESLAVSETTK